jgi:hypothetical protein
VSENAEEAALAFLLALEPSCQYGVYERLGELLAVPDGEQFPRRRLSRVARALHEAKRELGRSPSVREYEALRRAHPEWEWPSERSVKRWLGVRSWNDALVRVGLEPVVDGDVFERPGPCAYRPNDLIEALQQCAEEIGRVPISFNDYLGWALRPDVRERPGRRPTSLGPFDRIFGGFPQARVAAGLVDGDQSDGVPFDLAIHVAANGITEEEVLEHIRLVAERLGGPMSSAEYNRERRAYFLETLAAGRPYALASVQTIYRHFRYWSAALSAAGVDCPDAETYEAVYAKTRPPRPEFTKEQMLAALSEGYDAAEESFTSAAYARWRARVCAAEPRRRSMLPHGATIRKKFGTWKLAVDRMHEWRRANGG